MYPICLPKSYPLPVKTLSSIEWGSYLATFATGTGFASYKNGTVIHPVANVDRLHDYSQYCKTLPNDVFILGYPRCGNHFLSKILVELTRLDGNNINGKYKSHELYQFGDYGNINVPLLEFFISAFDDSQISLLNKYKQDTLNFYHSHLHADCLPFQQSNIDPNTKFIVLARNPKDALISSAIHAYRQHKQKGRAMNYNVFLEDNVTYFSNGIFGGSNYFDFYRKLWLDYQSLNKNDNNNIDKNHDGQSQPKFLNNNILWVYYEDLVDSKLDTIKNISNFIFDKNESGDDSKIDVSLTNEQLNEVVQKKNFDTMKKEAADPNSDYLTISFDRELHFRKGITDDWKNVLNFEQSAAIDSLMITKWFYDAQGIRYFQEAMENQTQNPFLDVNIFHDV